MTPAGAARSPQEIRADITATREELARTVEALSAKLDVRTRAKRELAVFKAWAADPANRPQVIAAGVAVVALLALRSSRKRRHG